MQHTATASTAAQFCELYNLPTLATFSEIGELLGLSFDDEETAEQLVRGTFAPKTAPQATKATPRPAAAPAPDQLAAMIAAAISPLIQPQEQPINEAAIIDLIKTHAPRTVDRTEIKINDQPVVNLPGKQHEQFKEVLTEIISGNSPYICGPAGSGKTQLAENIAAAIGVPFFCQSVCQQSSKSDFFGFVNAGGTYTGTHFRTAYENGGLFLIDEIDKGNPNILAVLNASIGGKFAPFADKMVQKHKDFYCIAAGNTFGHGADRIYVGSNPLDGATLDRFVNVDLNYDEELERELFPEVAEKIQAIRYTMRSEKVIVSMRKMQQACNLIRKANYTPDQAIKATVIMAIPANLRAKL